MSSDNGAARRAWAAYEVLLGRVKQLAPLIAGLPTDETAFLQMFNDADGLGALVRDLTAMQQPVGTLDPQRVAQVIAFHGGLAETMHPATKVEPTGGESLT